MVGFGILEFLVWEDKVNLNDRRELEVRVGRERFGMGG